MDILCGVICRRVQVSFFFFFEPSWTSQRPQHTTSHINTYQHSNTYQHAQQHKAETHHTTKHIFLSSTYKSSLYSNWHEGCRGIPRDGSCAMRTWSPNKEWTTVHALWSSRQVRAVCTERANCRSAHCHCWWECYSHTTPHHTRNTASTLRQFISVGSEQFANQWRAKVHALEWSLLSSLGERWKERETERSRERCVREERQKDERHEEERRDRHVKRQTCEREERQICEGEETDM